MIREEKVQFIDVNPLLKDLFEMVGPVDKAKIVYDASGRSTGVARIAFARYADTDAALEKYNNVELDGIVL